jgi:hypothetical protein
MNGIAAQCIRCGCATADSTCPQCSAPTHIAEIEELSPDSVRIGFLKRGRRAPFVVGFHPEGAKTSPPQASAIWPSGEMAEISFSDFARLSKLSGIASIQSLSAALFIAAQHGRSSGLLVDDKVDDTIVTQVINQDLPRARRAALVLGVNGAIDKLDVLPLQPPERTWLRAESLVRMHQFNAAIEQLQLLPLDRYPATIALLAACRDGADEPHRVAANESIHLRLIANGRGTVEGAAVSVALDGTRLSWIDRPGYPPKGSLPDSISSPSTELLQCITQVPGPSKSLSVPANASLDLIDDAIDRGAQLDTTSIAARSADRQYLIARTDPNQLESDEIADLGFERELVRRSLIDGSLNDGSPVPVPSDAYLAGLIILATDGTVTPAVAAKHPGLADELSRYLTDPTQTTLTENLAQDQSLWPRLSAALGAEAIGWNPPRSSYARRFLAWHWLCVGADKLFEAQWFESLDSLKHAFRLSDDEGLSDEALNLLACAHWQLGNDAEAQTALTSALEGSRNPSLQVNLGVVAQNLDPESAALELARLVREAASLELRTAAALKAVGLWLTDEVPWGADEERGMPDPLSAALRSVVVEDISIDAFRQIVKLQSSLDDDWLEQPGSLRTSPHSESLEARVYQARAAGPSDLVDVLVNEFKRGGTPTWVEDERDSLVEMFVRHAFADEVSGGGIFAFIALDRGLPLTPEQRAMLIPLAVHGVCDYFSEEEDRGAPNDKFTTMLTDGERESRANGSFERFEDLYASAWTRLAIAQANFSNDMLREAAGGYDRVVTQIGGLPKRRINMGPVRQVMAAIRSSCQEVEKTLRPFPPHIDGEVADYVNTVLSNARMLSKQAEEVSK